MSLESKLYEAHDVVALLQNLYNKTWLQLKQVCDELNISKKGNKQYLINKLIGYSQIAYGILNINLYDEDGDINESEIFDISCCFLYEFPNIKLPYNLPRLDCSSNHLKKLPSLPTNLQELYCDHNLLTHLPELPYNLEYLGCNNNLITSLPKLPRNLNCLYCNNNLLTSLPKIPYNLEYLHCNNNLITSLSEISDSLTGLYCNNNLLTSLPKLPNSLYYLECNDNLLTSLPILPDLDYLICDDNPFLYNRINIIKKFPNNDIFDYDYAFSNYKILLKLQRKQRIKTKLKLTKLLLNNKLMYNDYISVILRYY